MINLDDLFPNRESLLEINKDHEDKIKEIIMNRKIEYLVHFTRIENLSSILKIGLYSVSEQLKNNIHSIRNDEQRIDKKLDCTSCSVMFPNFKLFSSFRKYNSPKSKWVVILLDKDVLFSPDNIKYFCQKNAAGLYMGLDASSKKFCTADAFENMFYDPDLRVSLHINDYLTTDPQAEILISDIINTKYISGICFEKQSDLDEYLKKYNDNFLSNYDYDIIPGFFYDRKDSEFWR